MAATIKFTIPNKRQFFRKMAQTRQRFVTLNSNASYVAPEVWEVVNFYLEEKVRLNFEANRSVLSLQPATIRWKKWAAKSGRLFPVGPKTLAAKEQFISEYGQFTGFYQEQLEEHHAVDTTGLWARETATTPRFGSFFFWGIYLGKFHKHYPKYILKPPSYDQEVLGTLSNSPFALIDLGPGDVQAVFRILLEKHVIPLLRRFKARRAA